MSDCQFLKTLNLQISTTENLNTGLKKIERGFQISKHNLISQRENEIMGYTIVSGNKPSPVALHQNHAIIVVFIEMLLIKCQIFVLNLNMPKTKRDVDEEPTINNSVELSVSTNKNCPSEFNMLHVSLYI